MKISEIDDELIIRESPGFLWILSLLFAALGAAAVYGALGGFIDYRNQSPLTVDLFFIFGAAALGTGIWMLGKAPRTEVKINRLEHTVAIIRRGFYGAQQTVYDFEKIEKFALVEEIDSEGDKIWSVGLILTNGETIKINSLQSHSAERESKYVLQANLFIN